MVKIQNCTWGNGTIRFGPSVVVVGPSIVKLFPLPFPCTFRKSEVGEHLQPKIEGEATNGVP